MKKDYPQLMASIVLLASSCLTSSYAEVTFGSMPKGLDTFFKKNDKVDIHALSPWQGFVALQTYVKNLRFFGNYDFMYRAAKEGENNPQRQYGDDEGRDALTKIIKILYRSSGGDFNTFGDHPLCIGNYVNEHDAPEFVANLINYCYWKRVANHLQKEKVEKESSNKAIHMIKKEIENNTNRMKEIGVEIGALNTIMNPGKNNRNIRQPTEEEKTTTMNAKKMLEEERTLITEHSKRLKEKIEKVSNIANQDYKWTEEKQKEWAEAITKLIEIKVNNEIGKNFLKNHLLKEVDAFISNSGEYDTYDLERVILSFLIFQCDTKEQVLKYMEHLDDAIVDKALLRNKMLHSMSKEELLDAKSMGMGE